MATTVNAWVFPGSSGDRAYFSDVGHFRTEVGVAWTMATFVRLDSLTPGEDGHIFSLRKVSDNARNHFLIFDDNNNQLSYHYSYGSEYDAAAMSATTWYLAALTYSGSGSTVTVRLISAAGSQIGSASGTASSNFDDGQTQQITYGADYDGSSTAVELRGRMCLPLIVRGTALSQAALEAYAADPLNEGDTIVATYGSQVTWFDDSSMDQGPNGETLTLVGGVTLGSANGPSVPDRTAVGTFPAIVTVGKKSFGIMYDLELAVPYTGTDFGTDEPLVQLTNDQFGISNLVTQTVRSFGDTSGTFDCSRGALSVGPHYLKITNQTIGDPSYGLSDMMLISVRADPGAGIVAARRAIPTQNSTTSSAISTFDGAGEFYLRNAQESLTYSIASGSVPTGISINSSTGAITGTIDAGAAASSPYTARVRCTDSNGSYAEQVLSWVVGVVVATTYAAGSWGRRTRR